MNKYKIYCTSGQARIALELGAPLEVLYDSVDYKQKIPTISIKGEYVTYDYFIPTAEEMVEWLETQHVIVYAQPYTDECDKKFKGKIHIFNDCTVKISKSRKIAILAAIDAALNYLVDKNLK